MQSHYDAQLKDTVRYLGKTLGETIKAQLGNDWLEKIEKIRLDGRASYQGDTDCGSSLKESCLTQGQERAGGVIRLVTQA